MLNVRFAQLAELRNRLRHSRTVDDVTRKDGEAALLWFRHVWPTDSSPLRAQSGPQVSVHASCGSERMAL